MGLRLGHRGEKLEDIFLPSPDGREGVLDRKKMSRQKIIRREMIGQRGWERIKYEEKKRQKRGLTQ